MLKVDKHYEQVFTGGTFKIPLGKATLGELRDALKEIEQELATWGPCDTPIEILDCHRHRGLDVCLVNSLV